MKKILPTDDLCFKKAFASPQYPEIPAGLITDLLGLSVEGLDIENPYDIHDFAGRQGDDAQALTVVDVRARLSNQKLVTIEIQCQPQTYFLERALYLACDGFTSNYGRKEHMRQKVSIHGAKFSSLYPTFGINILDFVLFRSDDDPLRSFVLYDIDHKETLGKDPLLTVSFFELMKDVSEVADNIAHWKRFFKEGTAASDAPSYIKQAVKLVDYRNLSSEERTMINRRELAEEDRKAQLEWAHLDGIEKGIEKGVERGIEKGLVETAATALKEGLPPDLIQRITGLDLDTINKLVASQQ
jgi:predicted transposase/invertase (TIGR01784 family)